MNFFSLSGLRVITLARVCAMKAFGKDESFDAYAHRCVAHMALDFESATGGGVMRHGYMEQFITAWQRHGT